MTRQDYELIVGVINDMPAEMRRPLALVFAERLEGHRGNATFDRERFLEACDLDG